MVSTLKVNKIQIPNSDSDVISLDASTGNITLNKILGGTSITVQGEGTATTSLQQGLIKMWAGIDLSVTVLDSFNVSSVRDDAAGRTTFFINNDMANAGYSLTGMENQGEANTCMAQSLATGSFQFNIYTGSAYVDRDCGVKVSGDLA